jgi:hypothetical protein
MVLLREQEGRADRGPATTPSPVGRDRAGLLQSAGDVMAYSSVWPASQVDKQIMSVLSRVSNDHEMTDQAEDIDSGFLAIGKLPSVSHLFNKT